MPIYFKDQRAVLFVHVPKTGGTTIETLFRRAGWAQRLRETRETNPRLMDVRRCSPQHYHAAVLQELFDPGRFDAVFLMVREPLARFRSEYIMRHVRDPRSDAASVDAWATRLLARRREDPYVLDNHLRPQHEFVLPGAEVYRLETGIEAIVADLNARFDLGLATQVPLIQSSARRAGVPSSQVQLSDELLRELGELYAEDFGRFGYPHP